MYEELWAPFKMLLWQAVSFLSIPSKMYIFNQFYWILKWLFKQHLRYLRHFLEITWLTANLLGKGGGWVVSLVEKQKWKWEEAQIILVWLYSCMFVNKGCYTCMCLLLSIVGFVVFFFFLLLPNTFVNCLSLDLTDQKVPPAARLTAAVSDTKKVSIDVLRSRAKLWSLPLLLSPSSARLSCSLLRELKIRSRVKSAREIPGAALFSNDSESGRTGHFQGDLSRYLSTPAQEPSPYIKALRVVCLCNLSSVQENCC